MKKILIDGSKIQEKNEENDGLKWVEKFEKVLKKYKLYDSNYYLVLLNNTTMILDLNDIYDHITSKNLGNAYLSDNNTIVLKNEYNVTIEILKGLTNEEHYKMLFE